MRLFVFSGAHIIAVAERLMRCSAAVSTAYFGIKESVPAKCVLVITELNTPAWKERCV